MTRQEAIDTLDPIMDDFMACAFLSDKEVEALNFAVADMQRRELALKPLEKEYIGG